MKAGITSFFHMMGMQTWGDIGPFTVYRNKRGVMIWYLKAPPTKPPTDRQTALRDKWRAAAAVWRTLTAQQKRTWELASQKASLSITGYNLFIYWQTTEDAQAIATIERQTGYSLLF